MNDNIGLGASGVGVFFSDEQKWRPLFPNLEDTAYSSYLEKLASGKYTMEKRPAQDGLLHYIARGGEPGEVFVFQVRDI